MKPSFVSIALIIIILIFIPLDYNQQKMVQSDQLFSQYNEKISNAVEDASKELINNDDSSSFEISADGNKNNYQAVNLNLDKALWRFYKTLYVNFNIQDDPVEQQEIADKIPLKLAVGYDGYYVCSWVEQPTSSGTNKLQETWSNKINYTMLDNKNNIQINFTLDDYVYVTNLNTQVTTQGDQSSFISEYPNSVFGSKFEGVRRQVITNLIENDLKYYTRNNNELSQKYGLGYNFTIPYIDDTAINNVSFIAFLQGVPINGANKVFNSFALGIARTAQKGKWYGYTVNGVKYYHNGNFSKTGSNQVIFDSAKEAAEAGYYPDPTCQ
jgi:hypothetical protein